MDGPGAALKGSRQSALPGSGGSAVLPSFRGDEGAPLSPCVGMRPCFPPPSVVRCPFCASEPVGAICQGGDGVATGRFIGCNLFPPPPNALTGPARRWEISHEATNELISIPRNSRLPRMCL